MSIITNSNVVGIPHPQQILGNYFGVSKSVAQLLSQAGCQFAMNVDRQVKQAVTPLSPRTLPNGVFNDQYLKRVSDDVVITSGMVSIVLNRTNYTQAQILFSALPLLPVAAAIPIQGTFSIQGWTEKASTTIGSYVPNLFATDNGAGDRLLFDVPLGTTLEQARALLAGTVIRYQLATPVDIVNSPFINPLVDVVGKLGKNLLDPFIFKNALNAVFGSDGSRSIVTFGNTFNVFFDFAFSAGVKTLSFQAKSTQYIRCQFKYVDDTIETLGTFVAPTGYQAFTFTTNGKALKQINLYGSGGATISIDVNTLQLELGAVATTYEPYGYNNVLLQSFAGTTADGYTQIALPNGKNPWFLKFDGTDSLGIMANTADVDILGTNDFAISLVLRTHSSLIGSYIFSKGDGASLNQQFAVTTEADGKMLLILTGGLAFAVVPPGGLVANTLNRVLIVRKSGVLTSYLNGVQAYQSANAISITTKPNPRIGARAIDATGTAHTTFTNINLGNLAIFYNGATGLNISDIEKAVAKFNANYI